MSDLQYITTSREYIQAKHALDYAWQRLVRSCKVQPPVPRHPVGASAEFQIPTEKPGPRTYDLNDRWDTVAFDPMTGEFSESALKLRFKGSQVSLGMTKFPDMWEPAARKLYENARKRYVKAKALYFKKDTANIRNRMRKILTHKANLQLLGVDDEGGLEGLQNLANELCIDAVREYSHSPSPEKAKALLTGVAEAQLVGADDLSGVRVAQKMVNELFAH